MRAVFAQPLLDRMVMLVPDPKFIFSALGPLFLLLAAWSFMNGGNAPRGRTWLVLGVIFSAVAAWLWWSAGVKLAST